jgi:hypothetical protein
MNKDDIIRVAREAGLNLEQGFLLRVTGIDEDLERFAALISAHEREKVAQWMSERGYATGHGDTIEDLLTEIDWQAAEREREACRLIVLDNSDAEGICCTDDVLEAFRQRGREMKGTIQFWGDQGAIEVLRLSADGIWANPDISADDAAKLVLAAIDYNIKVLVQKAVEAEREECAKVADAWQSAIHDPRYECDCADAIRARAEK